MQSLGALQGSVRSRWLDHGLGKALLIFSG